MQIKTLLFSYQYERFAIDISIVDVYDIPTIYLLYVYPQSYSVQMIRLSRDKVIVPA